MSGGPASFQRQRGRIGGGARPRKRSAAGHVGKAAPRPMRGPTKARQICFELAKTKSKEQSYRGAMDIHTHTQREYCEGGREREREREELKKTKESRQSGEQRKKRREGDKNVLRIQQAFRIYVADTHTRRTPSTPRKAREQSGCPLVCRTVSSSPRSLIASCTTPASLAIMPPCSALPFPATSRAPLFRGPGFI
jgi:hypothetical protein